MEKIKRLDSEMFQQLDSSAATCERRRSNFNLHSELSATVQRLFISIYEDSYCRPHRHTQPHKWEFFMMVSGQASLLIFSEQGQVLDRIELDAAGPTRGVEIPYNTWHALCVPNHKATFLEVKQGPYEALTDKDFAHWSPAEATDEVPVFLAKMKQIKVGEWLG